MTSYRYPQEHAILALTLLVLLGTLALTAGLTFCLAPLLIGFIVMLSYYSNVRRQAALRLQALPAESFPSLSRLLENVRRRLDAPQVETLVTRSREVNAYTFGLSSRKVIVLYSRLFDVMDEIEMRFVFGHELGHAALGHTWINTLLGGMAGVPTTFGAAVIIILAFRWWNRACEYSADRAGLLACGSLDKAVTALIKLTANDARTASQFQRAYEMLEKEDDSLLGNLGESFSTHPMVINRIEQLQAFARSSQYNRLASEAERRVMQA